MLSVLISQFCILFIEIISFIQGCMFVCLQKYIPMLWENRACTDFLSHFCEQSILFIKCYESKSLFPCTITSNDVEFASTNPRMNEACQPCWTRNSGSAPGCSLYCSTSWWCWWGGPTRVWHCVPWAGPERSPSETSWSLAAPDKQPFSRHMDTRTPFHSQYLIWKVYIISIM